MIGKVLGIHVYAMPLSVDQINKCITSNMRKEPENCFIYGRGMITFLNGGKKNVGNHLVKTKGFFFRDFVGTCKRLVWMIF